MSESFRAIVTILGPVELPGHPDNELPGTEDPVDPDYGVGHEPRPPHVSLPPGFFPPHKPIVPRPPGRPPVIWPPSAGIDNTLPMPPPDLLPPGSIDNELPPSAGAKPVFPDSPGEPGTIWPPLPGIPEGSGNLLVIVWVPTVGYRWAVIDPSLTVDNTLPSPPTAQPK